MRNVKRLFIVLAIVCFSAAVISWAYTFARTRKITQPQSTSTMQLRIEVDTIQVYIDNELVRTFVPLDSVVVR